MKKLVIALLAALPAGAYACGPHGPAGGMMMMHGRPGGPGMLLAAGLFGLLAALGYWVLQHAAKETETCVKRAGKTVAWLLIVFGLLGLLCGVIGHIRSHLPCCGQKCEVQEAAGGPEDTQVQVQVKTLKQEIKKEAGKK